MKNKIIKHKWNGQKFYSVKTKKYFLYIFPYWETSKEVFNTKEEAKKYILNL